MPFPLAQQKKKKNADTEIFLAIKSYKIIAMMLSVKQKMDNINTQAVF